MIDSLINGHKISTGSGNTANMRCRSWWIHQHSLINHDHNNEWINQLLSELSHEELWSVGDTAENETYLRINHLQQCGALNHDMIRYSGLPCSQLTRDRQPILAIWQMHPDLQLYRGGATLSAKPLWTGSPPTNHYEPSYLAITNHWPWSTMVNSHESLREFMSQYLFVIDND